MSHSHSHGGAHAHTCNHGDDSTSNPVPASPWQPWMNHTNTDTTAAFPAASSTASSPSSSSIQSIHFQNADDPDLISMMQSKLHHAMRQAQLPNNGNNHDIHAPTPFYAPQLTANNGNDTTSVPFLASNGIQGTNIKELPPSLLTNPNVRIVVEHPLIFALKANDMNTVYHLLMEQKISAHVVDAEGNSALHIAAKLNFKPKKIEQHSSASTSASSSSFADEPLSQVDLLLKTGASLFYRNPHGETALHFAADHGCMRSSYQLLQQNYEIMFVQDNNGWMAWHRAAQKGHIVYLDFLLHFHPINRNLSAAIASTASSSTPTASVASSSSSILPVLSLSLADSSSKTALHWSAYNNNPLLTDWLLSNGKEELLFVQDDEKALPIHWAAIRGNADIIEMMLTKKWKGTSSSSNVASVTTNNSSSAATAHAGSSSAPLLAKSSPSPPSLLPLSSSPSASSLPTDRIGRLLFTPDITGMNILELAEDKRKRLQDTVKKAQEKKKEEEEKQMKIMNPNQNPVSHSSTSSATSPPTTDTTPPPFSLRNYSAISFLCCFYPLLLAFFSYFGLLKPMTAAVNSMYESCRKTLGMAHTHQQQSRLTHMQQEEKHILALNKTIAYLKKQIRIYRMKEYCGLIQPRNILTRFVVWLLYTCDTYFFQHINSLGCIISRWLGFIMVMGLWIYMQELRRFVVPKGTIPLLALIAPSTSMDATSSYPLLDTLFLVSWCFMMLFFLRCVFGDPGYIQQKSGNWLNTLKNLCRDEEVDLTTSSSSSPSDSSSSISISTRFTLLRSEYTRILTTASDEQSKQVCVSCRIYRQPRSKHCKTCEKCIEKFDHRE